MYLILRNVNTSVLLNSLIINLFQSNHDENKHRFARSAYGYLKGFPRPRGRPRSTRSPFEQSSGEYQSSSLCSAVTESLSNGSSDKSLTEYYSSSDSSDSSSKSDSKFNTTSNIESESEFDVTGISTSTMSTLEDLTL